MQSHSHHQILRRSNSCSREAEYTTHLEKCSRSEVDVEHHAKPPTNIFPGTKSVSIVVPSTGAAGAASGAAAIDSSLPGSQAAATAQVLFAGETSSAESVAARASVAEAASAVGDGDSIFVGRGGYFFCAHDAAQR